LLTPNGPAQPAQLRSPCVTNSTCAYWKLAGAVMKPAFADTVLDKLLAYVGFAGRLADQRSGAER
jgi:hypothetical protein